MKYDDLIVLAKRARRKAYAPYSRFPVGAALLTESGKVYTGCNVENASSGLTICAERVAVFKAVSEGERDLQAIAVVTESGSSPCGTCRQVLSEFAEDMDVVIADTEGNARVYRLRDLLPRPFPGWSLRKDLGDA